MLTIEELLPAEPEHFEEEGLRPLALRVAQELAEERCSGPVRQALERIERGEVLRCERDRVRDVQDTLEPFLVEFGAEILARMEGGAR